MKKYWFLLCVVFFASIFSLHSQWHLLNGPGKATIITIGYDANNWYAILGSGLFRSTNEGDDWKYFNNMGYLDPFAENCILNIGDTIYIGAVKKGFYYSTDAGLSWELITDGLEDPSPFFYYPVAFGRNSKHIFALTSSKLYNFDDVKKKFSPIEIDSNSGLYNTIYVSEKYLLVGSSSLTLLPLRLPNIFISKDNGKTWKSIIDSVSGIDKLDINCFIVINDTIYTGTQNGIYRSIDEGTHWELLTNGLSGYQVTNLLVTQDGVYAGTKNGMFYTSQIGKFWEKKEHGLTNNVIVSMSNINGKILAGTDRGLFYTTDKGDNWISINNGLGGGSIPYIKEDSNILYSYAYEEGIYSSMDLGDTWQLIVDGSKLIRWGVVAVDNKNIYNASNRKWEMFYSLDQGISWKKVPDTTAISGKRIFRLAVEDHKVIACTNHGIFISKDSARTWHSLIPALEPYGFNFVRYYDNYIYAGSAEDSLFISADNGATWEYNTAFGKEDALTDLIKTDNGIFVASSDYGIFKSTDNGMTWDSVNNGLSNKSVKSLAEVNNNVFASTKKGIFLSTNSGEEWKEVSDGLSTKYIIKLLIVNDNIYASSNQGIFRAKLSDFGITDVVDNQVEKHNYLYSYPPYPMPARDQVKTLIYWDTSIDIDKDKIEILDIFGNKIGDKKDITINKQSPYSGILTWNCSDIPNGIYFILITHGTEKRAIKVLVNK